MNPVQSHMPLFARHMGIWEGEYTHIAPDRSVQDQHLFRILAEIPDDAPAYRQTSHYWWPDGRTQQLVYEADYRDGRIVFDNGRIRGSLWELNEHTQYMEFGYASDPAVLVCEMMQLSPDGQHRSRTWHWLRNHELWRITLVRERRLHGGRAEFERLAGVVPAAPR